MAHVETWYRCLYCKAAYDSMKEARECAAGHVRAEKWAVSENLPGKAVSFDPSAKPWSYNSEQWALQEAELSDFVKERRKQIAEMPVELRVKFHWD